MIETWQELITGVLARLGPVYGAVVIWITVGVFGAIVQALISALIFSVVGMWRKRREAEQNHARQMELLRESHRQEIERREADRNQQRDDYDRADRSLTVEYIDMLLPHLRRICAIFYLGEDNNNTLELRAYKQTKNFMEEKGDADPAHPEKDLGLRLAFLLLQIMAAARLAHSAQWMRPLTDSQKKFLWLWTKRCVPALCSNQYPGRPFLYREQIQLLAEAMLVHSVHISKSRPLTWAEFVGQYHDSKTIKDLSDQVATAFRLIFVESEPLPLRKGQQARLDFLSLYFLEMQELSDQTVLQSSRDQHWSNIADAFRFEVDKSGRDPDWYVFQAGDIKSWIEKSKA